MSAINFRSRLVSLINVPLRKKNVINLYRFRETKTTKVATDGYCADVPCAEVGYGRSRGPHSSDTYVSSTKNDDFASL
jgi:hypothetical protein